MPSVWERFVDLFSSSALKDRETMDALWCNRAPKAVRRLGTIGEMRRIVAAAKAKGANCSGALAVLEEHCQREYERRSGQEPPRTRLTDDDEIGDPNDVHHIIPPKHDIGYAIEECEDGFALETIETLHTRTTILRLRQRIVGVSSTGVIRMEHYGPCRVV